MGFLLATVSESDEDEKSQSQDVDQEKGETFTSNEDLGGQARRRTRKDANLPDKSRKNVFVLGANDARLEIQLPLQARVPPGRSSRAPLKPRGGEMTRGFRTLDGRYLPPRIGHDESGRLSRESGAWNEALGWLNNADNFAEVQPVGSRPRPGAETDDFVKEGQGMLGDAQSISSRKTWTRTP